MIQNHVSTLLGKRRASVASMARDSSLAYSVCWKLYADKAPQVSFNTLSKLCRYFGCQPGDLFTYIPNAIEKEG